MARQGSGSLALSGEQMTSKQLVVAEPVEALWGEGDRPLGGGPDASESRVVVLKVKFRKAVEHAEDVDYEMTDDQGCPIPVRVTQYWEGSLLPLAAEPDVGIAAGDRASAD